MTYLDQLDIACAGCGATYTSAETHCATCHGRGYIWVDNAAGRAPCIACKWRAQAIERDRIRAAAEDRVEALYRDAGYDDMSPLEQWHADGAR